MIKKQAIELAVIKWENIVYREGFDRGGQDCFLCQKYPSGCFSRNAYKCPIYEITDRINCGNTPYEEWMKHHFKKHDDFIHSRKIRCKTCKKLAIKELEFLKSLK